MITRKELDKVLYTNEVIKMYEEINTDIVKEIIRKIRETGDLTSYTKHQIRVISRNGGKEIFKQAILKTNKISKKRKKELLLMYEKITKKDMVEYKELYEYRNKEYKLTNHQIDILEKMAKLTNRELKNYTRTIAFSSQKEFVNALDTMYKQVLSGGIDYQTAFRKTTNDLANKGITLKMKDGRNRSIEAAVRQNIDYGLKQTVQLINYDLADELEADAVQINITPNCRPTHEIINGKIFSLDPKNKKYPYFKKEYRELMEEYNCHHRISPFIIGVSEPVYTKKEIKEADNRVVNYKGKQISYYEATQKQRQLEREIRNAKKSYMSNPSLENNQLINEKQRKMRKFIKETGLERQYDREYFAGYNK